MGPLRQRLKFYGFACVQIDPRQPLQPWQWGLPGLQAVPRSAAWRTLLEFCQPFSMNTNAAVISNSLTFLRKIRQKSPVRWLIYCQTAFEKPPDRRTVRRLTVGKTLPFLHPNDACLPLFWLPGLAYGKGRQLKGYPMDHPTAKRLRELRERHPGHQIRCLENGLLAVQLNLFGPGFQPTPVGNSDGNTPDAYLLRKTADLDGAWLVVSSQERQLSWFRRDLIRLWRGRYRFWDKRIPAYHSVKGSLVALITDEDLKWGLPNLLEWPMLHLNGNARVVAYRHARQVAMNPPRWVAVSPVLGAAVWRRRGRSWRFQKTAEGWCNPVSEEPTADLSEEFDDLLACFRVA